MAVAVNMAVAVVVFLTVDVDEVVALTMAVVVAVAVDVAVAEAAKGTAWTPQQVWAAARCAPVSDSPGNCSEGSRPGPSWKALVTIGEFNGDRAGCKNKHNNSGCDLVAGMVVAMTALGAGTRGG